jgi:hypothetical protein
MGVILHFFKWTKMETKPKNKTGDFLGKHYPGIKRMLHKKRILNLQELLEIEKAKYKKEYHVEFNQ